MLEEKDTQREKHVVETQKNSESIFHKIVLDMLIYVQKTFDGWIIRDFKLSMINTSK